MNLKDLEKMHSARKTDIVGLDWDDLSMTGKTKILEALDPIPTEKVVEFFNEAGGVSFDIEARIEELHDKFQREEDMALGC